jgi:hypothetical protein
MRANINSGFAVAARRRKDTHDVTTRVLSLSLAELSQNRQPLKFNEVTVLATGSVMF